MWRKLVLTKEIDPFLFCKPMQDNLYILHAHKQRTINPTGKLTWRDSPVISPGHADSSFFENLYQSDKPAL